MKFFISVFSLTLLILSCEEKIELKKISGPVFGTTYNIQFYDNSNHDFLKSVDSLFMVINKSMSNYQTDSDISKLNRNEIVTIDSHFVTVFNASNEVYKITNGIFDPTIGNLVNYWNFGAQKNEKAIDSVVIDSLMQFVGFNKLKIQNNRKLIKPLHSYIDFNAVAKGYAVDVVSDFLNLKGISNHLVEIGGEIKTSGKQLNKQDYWKVGIQEPNFDGTTSYKKVISLQNEAMATSGTYRKYKVDDNGSRYAHIINTKTGYPTKTNILSVSVIAQNCMLADAYATAIQAMPLKMVSSFLNSRKELKAWVIFENESGTIETKTFNNFN